MTLLFALYESLNGINVDELCFHHYITEHRRKMRGSYAFKFTLNQFKMSFLLSNKTSFTEINMTVGNYNTNISKQYKYMIYKHGRIFSPYC